MQRRTSLNVFLIGCSLAVAVNGGANAAPKPAYRTSATFPGLLPEGVRLANGQHHVAGRRARAPGGPTEAVVRNAETGEERVLPGQDVEGKTVGDAARDLSPDSGLVVGRTEGPAGVFYPSRWTGAGELQLIDPPGVGSSELIAVNEEGTAVGNGPQGAFFVAEDSFEGQPLPLSEGASGSQVHTMADRWVGGHQLLAVGARVVQAATLWEVPSGAPRLLRPLAGDTDASLTGIARLPRGGGASEYVAVGYSARAGRLTGVRWNSQGVAAPLPAPRGVTQLQPERVAGKWCLAYGQLEDARVALLLDLATGEAFLLQDLLQGIEDEILVVVSLSEDGWVVVIVFLGGGPGGGLLAPAAAAGAQPDLVPSFENVTVRRAARGRGITIRGFLRVTNLGKKRAGASRLHLYLSGNAGAGGRQLRNFRVPPLRKGGKKSYRIIHTIRAPLAANYFWTATADAGGEVKESDEANNVQRLQLR